MKINVEGSAKELADLVLEIQGRQIQEINFGFDLNKTDPDKTVVTLDKFKKGKRYVISLSVDDNVDSKRAYHRGGVI